MTINPATRLKPHVVYRCYAASGALLYVGATHDLNKRLSQHRHGQGHSGWINVTTRVTVEDWPDRDSAVERENEVIRTEQPAFNVIGTGKWSPRVTGIERIEPHVEPYRGKHEAAAA